MNRGFGRGETGAAWVRWVSGCAMAEHPFMPVRTSFHIVCLGVKHPLIQRTMRQV